MGQKTLVGVGPEMVVERGEALLGGRLHGDAPAALDRFLDQGRQHRLQRLALQMVEEDLGHAPLTWARPRPRAGFKKDKRGPRSSPFTGAPPRPAASAPKRNGSALARVAPPDL